MEPGWSKIEALAGVAGLSSQSRVAAAGGASRLRQHDVCVVGGGPAGLASAIAAVQQGLTAVVVDGMTPPVDKACGEGLMPDTLAALRELGVGLDGASAGSVIRGIRFVDTGDATSAEAAFTGGCGRGMRRLLLHQILLDRATRLGVTFRWQTVVQGVSESGTGAVVETNQGKLRAGFVIGADGQASRVREWAGLGKSTVSARRIALRQHFAVAPWTDLVEVYWSDCGQAYVTPVSDDEVCVAFVAQEKFADVASAMQHFPQLRDRLSGAVASDAPRGAVTFSRTLRRVMRGRVALVGDASGSVDAVTGEGLSLCFRQALALAAAMRSHDLAAYEAKHAAMRRLPHVMASTLLLMDRSAWLRSRSIRMLGAHPELFESLLATHTGDRPVRLMGCSGMLATGLELGRHLLIA